MPSEQILESSEGNVWLDGFLLVAAVFHHVDIFDGVDLEVDEILEQVLLHVIIGHLFVVRARVDWNCVRVAQAGPLDRIVRYTGGESNVAV